MTGLAPAAGVEAVAEWNKVGLGTTPGAMTGVLPPLATPLVFRTCCGFALTPIAPLLLLRAPPARIGVDGVAAPDEFPDPFPVPFIRLALAAVWLIDSPGVLGPLGRLGVKPPI